MMINDRNLLLCIATKNRRIPQTATGQPTLESPKRVPDRQMDQPSFVLGGQYPITEYYVKKKKILDNKGDCLDLGKVEDFTLTGY